MDNFPDSITNLPLQNSGVKPASQKRFVPVDAVIRQKVRRRAAARQFVSAGMVNRQKVRFFISSFWNFFFGRQKFSFALVVTILFLGFFAGMVTVYKTGFLKADSEAEAPAAPGTVAMVLGAATLGPIDKVPNDVLFNLPFSQLEGYLNEALKTPEMKAAETLVLREKKLKEYLASKHSPFVEIVDTVAKLKHWKLVLAISNSESTLGKRCYGNNCSGIGVAPGHPLWRNYASTREWAQDLDRLLDKRYKDWTLERMNGVYNQPGSKNWLLAAKQVLEELQQSQIE